MDSRSTKEKNTEEMKDLERHAVKVRRQIIDMIYQGKNGHTGGSLSCVEILVSLYFKVLRIKPEDPDWIDRDRFIMSKGHSVEALYSVLAEAGFISSELLQTYGKFNSPLAGHPIKEIPGIELNSGALGHGLSVGTGMALAGKRSGKDFNVYVLMGDGEQGEGSIMEAAMSAAYYQLDNLKAIIDRNQLQISGNTEKVMALEPLKSRWESAGWRVSEVDGHDIGQLIQELENKSEKKPHIILANTIKGKGISFIENNYKWHHKVPGEEQYQQALEELENQLKAID